MPIPIVLEKRVVKERIENARRTYEITLPKGEIDFNSEDLKEKATLDKIQKWSKRCH